MTATASRVFLDTNILIYAYSTAAPLHATATAALQSLAAAGADVCVSRQTLREYLAGMTRPSAFTGTAPFASLLRDVRHFEATYRVLEDGPAVTAELLGLLAVVKCQGRQIHDANIVATMLAHGVPNLLTHNVADFTRFATLITVIPLIQPHSPGSHPGLASSPPAPGVP